MTSRSIVVMQLQAFSRIPMQLGAARPCAAPSDLANMNPPEIKTGLAGAINLAHHEA